MERKKPVTDSAPVENDKQFLERSGASSQIRDVISKVLENRPSDPVIFLAEYFESLGDKVDKTARAAKQVTQTHYTKPAFGNNVQTAYDILAGHAKVTTTTDRRTKVTRRATGQPIKALTGGPYMDLMHVLCKTFPPTVRDKLFRKLRCRDYEVVPFDVFKSAIFTCLVLKDFLAQSKALYESLDLNKSGKVDCTLCDAVTKQLSDAVGSTTAQPASVMLSGYLLAPKKVHSSVSTAFLKSSNEKKIVTQDDFVINAAETFLAKVQRLH